MEIKKFSKQKNGMYLLSLETGIDIKVHEDLILRYELLLHRRIDDTLLEKIRQENQIYEVYEVALRYLKTRLRSRKELYLYLSKKGYQRQVIESVLTMLKKQGYLDDQVYATSFVHDRILMSNDGPNRIRRQLEECDISNETITLALSTFDESLEKMRIEKIIEKKIKQNHNKGAMVLKRKIQAYLLELGYSSTIINQSLNGRKLVNEDISHKEYEKLYTKLSKKYSGRELEYKLKQKMYQKGFSDFNSEE